MRGPPTKTHCAKLRERLLALEPAAYQEFVEFFQDGFTAYYQSRGLTPSEAEDLATSSITDIALKIDKCRYGEKEEFDQWVFTLARHALWDWYGDHRIQFVSIDELTLDISDERLRWSQPEPNTVEVVSDALAQLSPEDQVLIKLRYFEQQETFQEISWRLGITAACARVRYCRAMKRLQRLIEADARSSGFLKNLHAYRWSSQKF